MSVETKESRAIGADEIRKDIADTEAEIRQHQTFLRQREMGVEHHKNEIAKRQQFIGRLRAILAERGEQG